MRDKSLPKLERELRNRVARTEYVENHLATDRLQYDFTQCHSVGSQRALPFPLWLLELEATGALLVL